MFGALSYPCQPTYLAFFQADFLRNNIKVAGKAGNLGENGEFIRHYFRCRQLAYLRQPCLGLFPLLCPAPVVHHWSFSAFHSNCFTVVVANDANKVTVTSPLVTKDNAAVAQVSKRYLRYLTKKYVAKEGLREYLRVLTSGPDAYKITFFDLGEDEEEE